MIEAFFGGLFSAIIVSGFHWWMNKQSIEGKARYLAIHVVCLLDKFEKDCISVIYDDGIHDENGCLEPQALCPNAPSFPNDIDWKSINYDLMYEILALPSDIETADDYIKYKVEYVAHPQNYEEVFEERIFQYAKLGLKAHNLATKLRDKYKIPIRFHNEWDPISEFNNKLEQIEIKRKKRSILQNKVTSE